METKNLNTIWPKWIFGFSLVVIIAGIFLGIILTFVLPQSPDPFLTEITGLSKSDLNPDLIRYQKLIMGVLGSTMIGWGIILAFLGYRLMQQSEEWIWIAITVSLIVWYIFDTSISLISGSFLNVILNSFFLILPLPPLIANVRNIIKNKTNG